MARLPIPGEDVGTWGIVLNDYLMQSHQADGSLKTGTVSLDKIATNTVVDLTNDQTVNGIKTFSQSPVVPAPTTPTAAASKAYVDGIIVAGNTAGATAGTAVAIDSISGTTGHSAAASDGSIAIGYNGVNAASATGSSSVAIGADSIANGEFALALGSTANSTGDSSTAIGWGAEANGEGAVALGGGTYSESGTEGAFADGYNALAIGSSSAQGYQSIAIGSSSANGYQATAMGFNSTAQGDTTTAIGSGAASYSASAIAVGFNTSIDINSPNASAIGSNTFIYNSSNSVAISGYLNQASTAASVLGNITLSDYGTAINGAIDGTNNGSAHGAVAIGKDNSGQAAFANSDNQFVLGTTRHSVQIPGTLVTQADVQAQGTVMLPSTAPLTPQDGQIWIAADGLYFQSGGVVHGPFVTP